MLLKRLLAPCLLWPGWQARRLDLALARHVHGMPDRIHLPAPSFATIGDRLDWLTRDGFHLGPRGYRLWATQLAETLERNCPITARECEPP